MGVKKQSLVIFLMRCLVQLSHLIFSVGNHEETKRLCAHALKLWRERGDELRVARTLRHLSDANRMLHLYEEGVEQAKEALEVFERHNDTSRQGKSLCDLAYLWWGDGQFDAAEEAAFRAIDLLSDAGNQFQVCQCHRVLGDIYRSKGETEKAISHLETALGIASSSNWFVHLFWIYHSLAFLFSEQGRFDDANTHIERAKSQMVNHPYRLARAMELQAWIWYEEGRFEDAKSEALRAVDVFEKVGAAKDVEYCRRFLQRIDKRPGGLRRGFRR